MKIYRLHEQYTKYSPLKVIGIDFCCGKMAEDILFGRVITRTFTDYKLGFWAKNYHLIHCGHCGAKIEDKVYREFGKEPEFKFNLGDNVIEKN